MEIFKNLRVVLVEPTHPGNIGAVARSMKTMGLSRLVLVKPKKFPHYEATKRAAGAENVLQGARLVDDLRAAVADCTLVFGTSVRDREVSWPVLDPGQAAEKLLRHLVEQSRSEMDSIEMDSRVKQREVAILFGRESSGLTNQELDLCHSQIRIPASAEYSSLNLSSAVQIISYELRRYALQCNLNDAPERKIDDERHPKFAARQLPATQEQCDGHMQHLQKTLIELDFIKTKPPTQLMRKLTRLYNKAQLSVEEVQILRGILSAIQQAGVKRP